ncbi:MBL fold metallo-hydrolase [Sporosarcina obsidiansis]|uniref:MBL fold metallo-hydrolase n=1 Tax=Sporosarcina obsidiansis TaxID=2660748 RepID=UPI00129BCAA3|nr:MBL fold metallo-hydrolase [Sporosarcina obsidiansis]
MNKVLLRVLGSAQDAGLPHPNCYCDNCKRAMDDPKFKRTAASLAIILPEEKRWHLIDATPDMKEQMIALQRAHNLEGQVMNSVFLTHAHIGHYPGLMFLGKESMNTKQVPVYTGSLMQTMLETHAPWSQLTGLENILLKEIAHDIPVHLEEGVDITPVEVPHRNEFSETFGFCIEGPTKKVLYIPDIDSWDKWEQRIEEVCEKVDICLLDATFFSSSDLAHLGDRDLSEIPHPMITNTMDRLQHLTDTCAIYFTHFNHSNPALHQDGVTRKLIESNGFFLADDGLEFVL